MTKLSITTFRITTHSERAYLQVSTLSIITHCIKCHYAVWQFISKKESDIKVTKKNVVLHSLKNTIFFFFVT
jgi:hypothetical protein